MLAACSWVSDRGITRTGVRPTTAAGITGTATMDARAGDTGPDTDMAGRVMAGRGMATPAVDITVGATLDSMVAVMLGIAAAATLDSTVATVPTVAEAMVEAMVEATGNSVIQQ